MNRSSAITLSAFSMMLAGCATRVMVEPSNLAYLKAQNPAALACTFGGSSWGSEYGQLAASALNLWNAETGLATQSQASQARVRLEPGMVLRVQAISASLPDTAASPNQPRQEVLTEFAWRIPKVDGVTRKDFLAIRYLMDRASESSALGATLQASRDEFTDWRSKEWPLDKRSVSKEAGAIDVDPTAREESIDAFHRESFASHLIALDSLALHVAGPRYDDCRGATARTFHEMLYATHPVFPGGGQSGTPSVSFLIKGDTNRIHIRTDEDWHFMKQPTHGGLTNFEVDIQVRIAGELMARDVPLGMSISAFEDAFGVHVASFKRKASRVCGPATPYCSFVTVEYDEPLPPRRAGPEIANGILIKDVTASDGTVMFTFGNNQAGKSAKSAVSLTENTKEHLMVAHGDVITIAKRAR